ncbi:hypothetical protein BV898_14246 [Hypsibius exemplaris]|uniref:Uncharacterized protein n=1 Tax=Hypsibius exemplaris TaxID=2072580 RepID=A0A1W0W8F6_HYPEX|nr:hypothetical protein BV898_14246 [Hypsibius exemplaris]
MKSSFVWIITILLHLTVGFRLASAFVIYKPAQTGFGRAIPEVEAPSLEFLSDFGLARNNQGLRITRHQEAMKLAASSFAPGKKKRALPFFSSLLLKGGQWQAADGST